MPEAMGMKAEMRPGEGPTFSEPLKSPEDLDKLKTVLTHELDYFYDSLFKTRIRLNGVVPLFGFSGGPWTLACYMIEGGGSKSYTKVKKWMYVWPEEFKRLLRMLTSILIEFLSS